MVFSLFAKPRGAEDKYSVPRMGNNATVFLPLAEKLRMDVRVGEVDAVQWRTVCEVSESISVPSFRPSSIILGRLGFPDGDQRKEPLVMKNTALTIYALIGRTLEERRAAISTLERDSVSPDKILPVAAMAHALKALGSCPEALGFSQPEHAVLFPPAYKSMPELAAVFGIRQVGRYVKYSFSSFNNRGVTWIFNAGNSNILPAFQVAGNVIVSFTPDKSDSKQVS